MSPTYKPIKKRPFEFHKTIGLYTEFYGILYIRFTILRLDFDIKGKFGALSLIWVECFAKVVKDFELLAIFAERFVHGW